MYQRHTLSEAFDPRVNSFTMVRLGFATAVAYVHALSFAGGTFEPFQMLHARHFENMASISVEGFFIISGFLITRSYVHAPSTVRYLWHRFLRIFPGFWVSLLLTVLMIGPLIVLIKGGSLAAYFGAPVNGPWTFITANGLLSIGQWALVDTTEGLPFPIAINGSLWTLRPEFDCYLIVAALGLLGSRIGYRVVLLPTLVVAWGALALDAAGLMAAPVLSIGAANATNLKLSVFFLMGSAAYLLAARIPMRWWLAALAFVGFLLCLWLDLFALLAPPLLAYIVLWLATRRGGAWLDGWGDISYGVYIYAFPLQQVLAVLGVHRAGPAVYFLATLLLVVPVACLSYRLVEAPALRLKRCPVWPVRRAYQRERVAESSTLA